MGDREGEDRERMGGRGSVCQEQISECAVDD